MTLGILLILSGNAPSSRNTALFTDVLLTPKMCLQNLKRDFSVVQPGFISYPQISDENKTIGLIRLLNVSMSVSCEIKLHVESLYMLSFLFWQDRPLQI